MAELIDALRSLGPEAEKAIKPALFVAADKIRAHAVHSITEGSISGKGHVPSNPGEPPNADTRHLDQSIETGWQDELVARVTARAPHAVPLEFGTSTVAERPFMRPAVAAKTEESLQLVAKAVEQALLKVSKGKAKGRKR